MQAELTREAIMKLVVNHKNCYGSYMSQERNIFLKGPFEDLTETAIFSILCNTKFF